jgi:hypothetical protein
MRFEMVYRAFQTKMLALFVLVAFATVAQSKTGNDSIVPLSIPPSAFWYEINLPMLQAQDLV